MPFGLTNAPAAFQRLMNNIFHDFLDLFPIIYLDDLLIFSKTLEAHEKHVRLVLKRLKENHLYAKLEKCEFDVKEVDFLGYHLSEHDIFMDKTSATVFVSGQRRGLSKMSKLF